MTAPIPFTRPLALLTGLVLSFAACSRDSGLPTEAPIRLPVATIVVTPPAPSVFVGETLQLQAVPHAENGSPLLDRAVTWTSGDTRIATVNAAGVVQALNEGVVRLTATSEGVASQVNVEVDPIPAAVVEIDAPSIELAEGAARDMQAVVRDSLGRVLDGRPVTWISQTPAVATVSADGEVRAVREGQVRILARHGTLEDTLAVRVRAVFDADLLFDVDAGDGMGPRLFRADLMTENATPLFGSYRNWQASVSPDGTRVAFTCISEPTEGPVICTTKLDGSELRILTNGDLFSEDQPAWSPDGTRIAFRRWAHGGPPGRFNQTDIGVIDADGTDQVNLTADALVQQHPAWSPQRIGGAYRIVYSQESVAGGYQVARLLTMRDDGTDRQALTPEGMYIDDEPAWSPDGATIVFVRQGEEHDGELFSVSVGTKAERLLLSTVLVGRQGHPAWSPDGRHLAFTSLHEPSPNGDFRRQVYTVRADGSGLFARTTSSVDKEHLAWLPRR